MPTKTASRVPLQLYPSLTVLVPAFNEAGNLAPTVERLIRALDITVDDYEIMIVNDGSDDGTGDEADALAKRYDFVQAIHHERNMGLGASYAEGIALGTKDYFTYIPGDNTWPYRSFVQLFSNLGKSDIVTSYSVNPEVRPAGRRIVSRLYTAVLNLLFGHRLHYYNGLTIYPKNFLALNPITTGGFGFQAEVLLKGVALGLDYIEVGLPIDERTAGGSKAFTLRNFVSVAATIARLFFELRLDRGWSPGGELGHSLQPLAAGVPVARRQIEEIGLRPREGWAGEGGNGGYVPARTLNIVLTGASSGIGASLAKVLAEDGHSVWICARREDKLVEVTGSGAKAEYRVCDLSNAGEVKQFIESAASALGHIDVLINCAGFIGPVGNIREVDHEEWLESLKINLWGPFLAAKFCLPHMAKSKQPQIINFSGGGAFAPFPNYSAYAASKAGIVRLTETLALELAADGIMVNAIAPGMVASPIHEPTIAAGEKRAGRRQYHKTKAVLEEGGAPLQGVIDCVRALLSPEYRGLTGKAISVNFDPWRTQLFRDLIPEISRSDLFAQRRINIWNMPEGRLRDILASAWSRHDTQI